LRRFTCSFICASIGNIITVECDCGHEGREPQESLIRTQVIEYTMDQIRGMLRYFLASIAYNATKAIRDASDE